MPQETDSRKLIQGALRMKNMMRPGPMEMRRPRPQQSAPRPQQPAPQPMPAFAPEPPKRGSVYSDLMKKHDALNPRIKL